MYPALTRVSSQAGDPTVEMTSCAFHGMEFSIPTAMIANARIDRSSGSDIYLVFEDSDKFFQIPLSVNSQLRNFLSVAPSTLTEASLPQLIETIISVSTSDFSFFQGRAELETHEWAIGNRELLGVDGQNMTHYTRFSKETFDSILISADPQTIDSKRRIRSVFIWESADRQRFGALMFGDERRENVSWIDAVSDSFEFVGTTRLNADKLQQMSDDDILAQLKIGISR